jgi:hypothetical protein
MATFLFGGVEGVLAQAPITYCLQFGSTRHALSALCTPKGGCFQKHAKQPFAL